MKDETLIAVVAVISLLAYGLYALHCGIDSLVTIGVTSGIAGIAGYEIKAWRISKSTP